MVLQSKEKFLSEFMEISENLTSAELRMLYMIIKEPNVIDLSQEQFAKKIKVNRRTINIGLKKLRVLNLISPLPEISSDDSSFQDGNGWKNILKGDVVQSKRLVQYSLKAFYHRNPKGFVVNEDYFCRILGDYGLHSELRYNKDFIIQTIKEFNTDCRFCFEMKKSSYETVEQYYLIGKLNSEIKNATGYYLDMTKILQYFSENYSLGEEVVRKVIKENFPGLRIVKDRIRMEKPFKGKNMSV